MSETQHGPFTCPDCIRGSIPNTPGHPCQTCNGLEPPLQAARDAAQEAVDVVLEHMNPSKPPYFTGPGSVSELSSEGARMRLGHDAGCGALWPTMDIRCNCAIARSLP